MLFLSVDYGLLGVFDQSPLGYMGLFELGSSFERGCLMDIFVVPPLPVIPAQAGICLNMVASLDSCLRRNDKGGGGTTGTAKIAKEELLNTTGLIWLNIPFTGFAL